MLLQCNFLALSYCEKNIYTVYEHMSMLEFYLMKLLGLKCC